MYPLEWQTLKGLIILRVNKAVEQLELSDSTYGNIKCYNHFGKLFGSFLNI